MSYQKSIRQLADPAGSWLVVRTHSFVANQELQVEAFWLTFDGITTHKFPPQAAGKRKGKKTEEKPQEDKAQEEKAQDEKPQEEAEESVEKPEKVKVKRSGAGVK